MYLSAELRIKSLHCGNMQLVVYETALNFWPSLQHSGLLRVCAIQCAGVQDHRDHREKLQDACYLHFENQVGK